MKSLKPYLVLLVALTLACHKQPSYQSIGTPYTPNYSLENNKNDIAGFEKLDAAQMPAPGGIVLTGRSSFRLWRDAGKDLAPLPIINRGFGGSTTPEAVSYTHLDVYKRQCLHRPTLQFQLRRSQCTSTYLSGFSGSEPNSPVQAFEGIVAGKQYGLTQYTATPDGAGLRAGTRYQSPLRIGSTAVSYTHLDVYKRQTQY